MISDGSVVAVCGVAIAVVNVVGQVVTTIWTNRKVDRVRDHVDNAVEKGVENVKKELRQSRGVKVIPFGVEVAREPEIQL